MMLRQLAYQELDAVLEQASRPLVRAGLLDDTLYAAYSLDRTECVGTVTDATADDVRSDLRREGYEPSGLLAALKLHPETGQPDAGSLRRVDPEHPRWHWHVHLFAVDGDVEFYSHYEFRPDLGRIEGETHSERVQRLREHHRPTWGHRLRDETTYVLGACDEAVAGLLDVDAMPDRD